MGDETRSEFETFARAQMPSLLRFAWLITGQGSDAEDLLQSSLARTLQHWDRVCRADDPASYVRRLMVNAHRSRLRLSSTRREVPTAELPETPQASASGIDDRDALRTALASLPRAQRAVIVLRFVEDRTEADTANVLGIAVGTVKSQTHRALAKLREHPALSLDRSTS